MASRLPHSYPAAVPGAVLREIRLLDQDHETVLGDLTRDVQMPQVTRRRRSEDAMKLTWITSGLDSLREASRRRTVDLVFEMPSGEQRVEPWRIIKGETDFSGQQAPSRQLRPMWLDLAGLMAYTRPRGPLRHEVGSVDLVAQLVNLELRDALLRFFKARGGGEDPVDGWLGMPEWARLGSVESDIADRKVSVFAPHASLLSVLRALVSGEQGACEYRVSWAEDASVERGGYYRFDFASEIGRDAGAIEATPGSKWNRIDNTARFDSKSYFSGVSAVAREGINLSHVTFRAQADSTTGDVATLTLPREAVPYDGFGVGRLYIGTPERGFALIEGARFEDAEVDASAAFGFEAGDTLRYALDADGTPLRVLEDYDASEQLGRKVRPVRFPQIVPFQNLSGRSGASPDMQEWETVDAGEPGVTPPNASFDVSVDGLDVTVTVTSTDPEGRDMRHLIKWGDGDFTIKGASASSTHTYDEPGSYTIDLRTEVGQGNRGTYADDTASETVTVSDGEIGEIGATASIGASQSPSSYSTLVTVSATVVPATGRLWKLWMDDPRAEQPALLDSFERAATAEKQIFRTTQDGSDFDVEFYVTDAVTGERIEEAKTLTIDGRLHRRRRRIREPATGSGDDTDVPTRN